VKAENVAFTERLISTIQARPSNPDRLFVDACTHYLLRVGRLVWDDARGLFWVIPHKGSPQVAVWMPMLEPGEGGINNPSRSHSICE
jgi:hypothetical protein